MKITPIWSDSMGAKSLCTFVETRDIKIIFDPGAAIMQKSFPASEQQKTAWLENADKKIRLAYEKADLVVITHYHFDHFSPLDSIDPSGKKLFIKNPNEYINRSQRKRAYEFIDGFYRLSGKELKDSLLEPKHNEYPEPLESIPVAVSHDFSDYSDRRNEVLRKGLDRFKKLTEFWKSLPVIPPLETCNMSLTYPEGQTFHFGETTLCFTKPLFHGIEFATVGWVFACTIKEDDEKMLYSSDLCGPVIEDYADWIIREDPDFLVLDGPPTYLHPYLFNSMNMKRSEENIQRILDEINPSVFLLDHHLLRDKRFREKIDIPQGKTQSFAQYLKQKPALRD